MAAPNARMMAELLRRQMPRQSMPRQSMAPQPAPTGLPPGAAATPMPRGTAKSRPMGMIPMVGNSAPVARAVGRVAPSASPKSAKPPSIGGGNPGGY